MRIRNGITTGGIVLAAASFFVTASEAAAPSPDCTPDGALQFVCGPKNAEDLERLGDTQWLIASGMDGALSGEGGSANGKLYLVDHRAKRWQEAFPGNAPAFRHDRTLYGGCPGPVNPKNF